MHELLTKNLFNLSFEQERQMKEDFDTYNKIRGAKTI